MVGCYICQDDKGKVVYKGEAVRNYIMDDVEYASCRSFDCKEPQIIAKGIVDYLLFGIDPEETVDKNKQNLKMFQYACKKGTFDYVTEDQYLFRLNSRGKQISELYHSCRVKPLNRVFAKKIETMNGYKIYTILTKHKDSHGKHSKTKISNLPDSVFIYNEDINNAYDILKDKIDYDYYVNRIYERILEFVNIGKNEQKKDKNTSFQQIGFDL